MNPDEEGTHMSERGNEPQKTPDRSALAEDDVDLAEAFKLATGRCPLEVQTDDDPPA
jgi:hypothetical protein